MNAKQTNRLASYTATEALLKANPDIANVPELPGKVAAFSEKIAEINRLAKTQTQPVQARTTERDQMLEEMTDATLELAGYVRSAARTLKRPQLAQSVQVGAASFRRARRSHRMWFAQRVHDAAAGVLENLAPFGVTAEKLAAFQARIQVAGARVNMPRETVAEKRGATEQLQRPFADLDAFVRDELDPLVFPMRKTDPEWFSTYRAALAIVDRRGPRRRAEAEASAVADAANAAPAGEPGTKAAA
jgi:hypothetical protein